MVGSIEHLLPLELQLKSRPRNVTRMGRKKRRATTEQARIFCYYCERNFGTEQTLLSHQKEKHLRCPTCNKRMISVSGLVIHSQQVHNVVVNSVPNAIQGRTNVAVDVVGMNGIPPSYYAGTQGPIPKQARTDVYSAGAYAAQRYYSQPPPQPASNYPYYNYAQHGYYNYNYNYSIPGGVPVGTPVAPVLPTAPVNAAPSVATAKVSEPTSKNSSVTSSKQSTIVSNAVTNLSPTVVSSTPTVVSSAPTTVPKAEKSTSQQVKVVFANLDVSMEELRAKLPRYKISVDDNAGDN